MKKIPAATLIESIVSMVILSILLSVSVLIAFNLYRSFPSIGQLEMEYVLSRELDSLAELRLDEEITYSVSGYEVTYETYPFEDFEYVRVALCNLVDSSGFVQSKQKIFYLRSDEEEKD